MMPRRRALAMLLLRGAPILLFAAVLAVFGALSDAFLGPESLKNLVVQSSSTAIVAVGMTFVLIAAGVDLSVGSVMFVAAAVAGKLALAGGGLPLGLLSIALVGLAAGALNAVAIVGLRMIPFIVTLAALFLGRGLGLWITETRAMNLPEEYLRLGAASPLGVPLPIWILAAVVAAAQTVLSATPFGRRLHALGQDPAAARKAGIPVGRYLAAVYVASGFCAALGGILSLSQLGAVSPTFGSGKEFDAIAAAVLGGTSLSGGRGSVFPGTILGALLIGAVYSGLVMVNADPYLYPLITSAVIFAAVLIDAGRGRLLERLSRREIRGREARG